MLLLMTEIRNHRALLRHHGPVRSHIEQLTALVFKFDDSSLNMSCYHQGNRYSLATRALSSSLNVKAWVSDHGCPSAMLSHSSASVSTSDWFIVRLSFSPSLHLGPCWQDSWLILASPPEYLSVRRTEISPLFSGCSLTSLAALPPHDLLLPLWLSGIRNHTTSCQFNTFS